MNSSLAVLEAVRKLEEKGTRKQEAHIRSQIGVEPMSQKEVLEAKAKKLPPVQGFLFQRPAVAKRIVKVMAAVGNLAMVAGVGSAFLLWALNASLSGFALSGGVFVVGYLLSFGSISLEEMPNEIEWKYQPKTVPPEVKDLHRKCKAMKEKTPDVSVSFRAWRGTICFLVLTVGGAKYYLKAWDI